MMRVNAEQVSAFVDDPLKNKWGMGRRRAIQAFENAWALKIMRGPHTMKEMTEVVHFLVERQGLAIDPDTGLEI